MLKKNKVSIFIIATVIVMLLTIAHYFSIFEYSNALINDQLIHSLSKKSPSEHIIVIEADKHYSNKGDQVWLMLLNTLLAEDVRQIVFNFLPEHVSSDFYQLAEDSDNVVFARRFITKTDDSKSLILQPLPSAAVGKKLTIGLIQEPDNQSGVYRQQHAIITWNKVDFPSLEWITAQRVLSNATHLPQDDYQVNFKGGLTQLPRINITRVLASGLVSELVVGRTVFVGVHGLETVNHYFTPLSSEEGQLPAVLFQAFALNTLLSADLLTPIAKPILYGLIILIAIVSFFIAQRFSFQRSCHLSLFLSVVCLFLNGWLLHQFFLLLSLTELLLTQWFMFTTVWYFRIEQEKYFLDTLLFDLSFKLQEKLFPMSFYHSEPPWDKLIIMLNQTINFNRLIFLEPVQGHHRLKEISVFNCSINDIKELRRDYERTPYSTAINENRAVLLKKTNYFKKVQPNELEYLVPLIFAEEVLGFWAFTINASRLQTHSKFTLLIDAYMYQISEILHYRSEWKKRLKIEKNNFLGYVRVTVADEPHEMINKSMILMDRRMSELQEIFHSLTGCSILYDLFGRVLLVNKQMDTFAEKLEIHPYHLSMLDFLINITQFEPLKIQRLLQQTIFDRKTVIFPLSFFDNKLNYILYIKPLEANQKQSLNNFDSEAKNFQMVGVLCELVDVTKMKKNAALKEQMFERFSFQMCNDMASILFALALLEDENVSVADKKFVLNNIQGKVDETLQTLNVVSQQMNKQMRLLFDDSLECYPIDAKYCLNQAINKYLAIIEEKNIQFNYQIPELISLVFASPIQLENILSFLLAEMIEDTYQFGILTLDMEEKENTLYFRFENKGIGLSNDKIQNSINNDNINSESVDLLVLQNVSHCVEQWGGSLDLSSQVGQGSKIELSLRGFM